MRFSLSKLSFLLPALIAIAGLTVACGTGDGKTGSSTDSADGFRLPDTLRVVTLYSPMSYFHYRDEVMGYDYNLITDFADSRGLELDLTVAPSLERAVQMLDSGIVDVIAYEVPVTAEYRQIISPCGPEWVNTQVLVQNSHSERPVRDVTELVGREVWVERNSKYQYRLQNLNRELGGGIIIRTIDRDTLISEDVIGMVSRGEFDLTVVDSDIARVNRTYYNNIDATLEISFGQHSRWAVAADRQWLGDSITAWFNTTTTRERNDILLKKYFQEAKLLTDGSEVTVDFSSGRISPYDDLFKKYAAEIGWDWRLLASQGWVESQFRNDVVSWAGAKGLMQIMPSTARAYGVTPDSLTDPETSIKLAAEIIASLGDLLKNYITDPDERKKFIIAAYNSGAAHILDAIALAEKYNRNPDRWDGNVNEALLMKSDPRFYRDPVVRFGYFRGEQTTAYVSQVFDFYRKACAKIKH